MKRFILFIFLPLILFASTETIVIKDSLNREVKIKKEINRVIALGSSLSLLSYLKALDKVVAIEATELKDITKRTYTYIHNKKFSKLPIIGSGDNRKFLNYEAILEIKPDLIFTLRHNKSEIKEISEKLHIPIIALSLGNEKLDLSLSKKSLLIVGKVLKKEKRALELISYINTLEKSFFNMSQKKEAYIAGLPFKGLQGLCSSKTNFTPFELAKVQNITSKLPDIGNIILNKEFLLKKNPSTIFVDSFGWKKLQEEFKKDKHLFKKLNAFRKENVYTLLANNYYFYNNLDQMLANSFFIAKTMYPQKYQKLNPVKKTDEIFTMFVKEAMYEVLKTDINGFRRIIIKNNQLKTKEF